MVARKLIALRLSGLEWIDKRAKAEGLTRVEQDDEGEWVEAPNRSEMIRIALAYAAQEMPRGWRPEGWEPTS